MSLAQDYYDIVNATGEQGPAGADAWLLYGQPACRIAAELHSTSYRIALGGSSAFRTGFINAAEGDGFTVTNVLLSTDVVVSWNDPNP